MRPLPSTGSSTRSSTRSSSRPASLDVHTVPDEYAAHRYVLELRLGDAPRAGGPRRGTARLVALMKNPSTASAERLDPTIGKVRAWAIRQGFGVVAVVNLFALRATHPPALNRSPYELVVGPENDHHIRAIAASADLIVLGWGNPNGLDPARYARRIAETLALLAPYPLHVVGPLTAQGHPRHGLLWNRDCELAPWGGASSSSAATADQARPR